MNWSAISLIAGTDAYFNDTEVSGNNILTAGALDFESAGDSFAPEVNLGQDATKTISVLDTDSTMDYSYTVRVDPTSLSGGLCDYLFLKDDLTGTPNISLADFESDHEVLYSEKQNWEFTASLNTPADSNWENKECVFDLVYEGWQDNIAFGTGGFSDIERISNKITAGEMEDHLLITKVYYDPDNDYKGTNDARDYEWVEIYNPTDEDVDILGWKICDGAFCDDTLSSVVGNPNPSSIIIPSGGFAIVAAKNSMWQYWNIPDDVIKIELNSYIGGGLNNNGDWVALKSVIGGIETEVDAVNYGSGTYTYNYTFTPPPCPDVAKGHMLGRFPVGQDTNSNADWQDLGLPTVNVVGVTVGDITVNGETINSLESEHCGYCKNVNGGTCNQSESNCHCAAELYYGQELNITWSVTNPNATEPLIDIVYITDEDCSGNISDGDKRFILASGEVNDGSYTWDGWNTLEEYWNDPSRWWWKDKNGAGVLPFYGLTWIEITATGTENFMVNDFNTSIAMFEPLPPIPQGVNIEKIKSVLENYSCGSCCSAGLDNYLEADNFVEEEPAPSFSQEGNDSGAGKNTGASVGGAEENTDSANSIEDTTGDDEDEMGILGNEDTGENSGDGGDPDKNIDGAGNGSGDANTAGGGTSDDPVVNPSNEEMKGEEGGEASGNPADGSDGDDGKGSGGAATDTTDAATDTTNTTDNADDKEPAVPDLSSQEDDGAADNDSGLSITNDFGSNDGGSNRDGSDGGSDISE